MLQPFAVLQPFILCSGPSCLRSLVVPERGLFGIENVWETEYRIRFIQFETDSVFCFIKKFANFIGNGIQNPFHTV
ncbi:hypothetical protein DEO72_LG8g191 [Vigna unguiculata]|uniref:Uncharacterized protein n=1 Tax=Vigna unguiculata TaxID=3917 RepID=A0A4D6MKU0_VIGUN|nr:hypothetical protein DEO72_LG8g191 [Vigna unguiculata]